MTPTRLHDLAIECGATVLGDPHHYLMSEDQLADFAASVGGDDELAALLERNEARRSRKESGSID